MSQVVARTCSVEDCDSRFYGRGFCAKHYAAWRKYGDPLVNHRTKYGPVCAVDSCDSPQRGYGFCPKHAYRHLHNGDPLALRRRPNGSGHINQDGYRRIGRNGKVFTEHRLVMEDHIGRSLRPEESVHHRNGDRLDNRLSNLELWTTSHPKGQRVEDKLRWAREILVVYG